MNYKIEAILILLNKECILERYYPLIPYKEIIVKTFKANGINIKEEALGCDKILNSVFNDTNLTLLFKRFLNMYDINKSKLKETEKLSISDDELKAYKELYLLPGVKETRAKLYYLAGLKTLKDIANKSSSEIMKITTDTIVSMNIQCKAPLEKEVNTHIAVAKVLIKYLV